MSDIQTKYDYTVILPCLNEEITLGFCINEIFEGAKSENLTVEVIVSDNGSTDSSIEVAKKHGARIVNVPIRGYGAALNAGIREAKSEVVVIGDSDMSYDFRFAPRMYKLINQGQADLVMGNRFKGGIEPGAMPKLHKYLGNPALSLIGRVFFNIPIGDFHCGLRALRKSTYLTANPVTTGMEFATEMVARFANINARIVEVPVPLRKDGRNRKPHLRSFPDGWRHLKMMLLYSPHYFQLLPGALATVIGLVGLAMFGLNGRIELGFAQGNLQTAIFALVTFMVGLQLISASFVTMAYAKSKGINRFKSWDKTEELITSNIFVFSSILLMTIGIFGLAILGGFWVSSNFSAFDPITSSQKTIPCVAIIVAGTQGILCSIQVRQLLSKFW
jgi:glycosyltransferase involved in cell wall biosynthesis